MPDNIVGRCVILHLLFLNNWFLVSICMTSSYILVTNVTIDKLFTAKAYHFGLHLVTQCCQPTRFFRFLTDFGHKIPHPKIVCLLTELTTSTQCLSLSHPPLWRIDLPVVERRKQKRKKENKRYRLDSERTHMIALVSRQASTLLDIGNGYSNGYACIGN